MNRKDRDAGRPGPCRYDGAMEHLSDEHLMTASVRGSPDGFDEIVRRYTPRLLGFISGGVPTLQDAEDIVQETFLRAYRNRDRFDPRQSLKCWLFTIAHRCRISFLRRRPAPITALSGADVAGSPLDEIIQRQEAASLWQEARRLPESQFTALWLRYQEDLDVGQIARVMAKSNVHVRVLLHRARQTLAAAMQADDHDTDGSDASLQIGNAF